ncbi:MAG: glycosyltransferase family 4 protein [Candidatus Scalindua sp.]
MLNNDKNNKRTLCFIVSSRITVQAFLIPHIKELEDSYNITVVANIVSGEDIEGIPGVRLIPLVIERKINFISDLFALINLYKIFKRERFDIIHSVTPKAGLLAMLAGYFSRTPIRVHTFTGQVWATKGGIKRILFRFFDKVIARAATNILVDSKSQREFLLDEGVVSENKSKVLLSGSICGVDIERFSQDKQARASIRNELGISDHSIVFLYLGRLSRDKGILDLVHAFSDLSGKYKDIHLVIIGPDEDNLQAEIVKIGANSKKKIHLMGYTDIPQEYMAAADIFCLPSYREGFGNVIIEAASTGIPAIGCNIYGVKDAIQEGITGLLYEPRNINELESKMQTLIDDPDLRKRMGKKASEYTRKNFNEHDVVIAQKGYYEELQGNPPQ